MDLSSLFKEFFSLMKHRSILVCFVSLFSLSSFGYSKEPDAKVDSLKRVLQNQNSSEKFAQLKDTTRIRTLNLLSWELITIGDFNNAIKYVNEAVEIAENLPPELDKQKQINLSQSFNNMGLIHWYKGEYYKALEYHSKALKIREHLSDKEGIAISLSCIGMVYKSQGDCSKALELFFNSLKLSKELESEKPDDYKIKKSMANLYVNIGSVYEQFGEYSKALDYGFKSLKIFEEINFRKGIAISYNNIGHIYQDQSNFPKALEQFQNSLEIRKEIGDKFGISLCMNNIASNYGLQGDISNALDLYFKTLKLKEELGDKNGEANALNNIGCIYYESGDYLKALENNFKAIKISEKINNKAGIAIASITIGMTYSKLKNFKVANQYLIKALSISKVMGNKEVVKTSYRELAILDSTKGDYRKAFEHYKLYMLYKDSLINEEEIKKTVEYQMQYDFDKKETLAKVEQDKKEASERQQKLIRDIIIVSFILIFILSLILLKNYRQRQKALLKLKESEMDLIKMEAEEAQKSLEIELLRKESEKIKKELEIELLIKESEEIKREIIDFSLQSLKNKEFIELTRTELKNIKKIDSDNTSINNLFAITNQFLMNEQERTEFQKRVEGIQKSFFEKLDEQITSPAGSKLTKTEKKLAGLLKLQLSSKEISPILNVSETTIEIYRSRLRKKLNIDANISLSDYFNNI